MKNYLLALSLILATVFVSKAQMANAVLFTENGEQFTVVLNGVQQNAQPATNVKMTNLNTNVYKIKVLFSDASIGSKDFNLYVEPGQETTYAIHKNDKGEYKLKGISKVAIVDAPPVQQQQNMGSNQSGTQGGDMTGGTTTTQQTTTVTSGNPNSNVNVGMNVNGMGMGISIQGTDMSGTSTTTTTTTVSSSSSTSGNVPNQVYQPAKPDHYVMQGYNGAIGCPWPMSEGDFNSAKGSISSKPFEENKLTIAKQIIGSNCLTCGQVKQIMTLFSFEQTKLDFAKYAYGYTYDLGNYYKLNDAFTFSSSIDELNAYIQSHQR
jgi:hypothetical protein